MVHGVGESVFETTPNTNICQLFLQSTHFTDLLCQQGQINVYGWLRARLRCHQCSVLSQVMAWCLTAPSNYLDPILNTREIYWSFLQPFYVFFCSDGLNYIDRLVGEVEMHLHYESSGTVCFTVKETKMVSVLALIPSALYSSPRSLLSTRQDN